MAISINEIQTHYFFQSSIGELSAGRYINDYKIEIYGLRLDIAGDDTKPVLIGRAKVSLILLNLAINTGFNFYTIFDCSEEMLDFGNLIYDLDSETIKKDIEKVAFDSINSNILYIDRIEILPEYRQFGWGKKVIKDILFRFSGCYGFMALKAFPLQLKKGISETEAWNNKMGYDKMEQNEYLANKRLFKFYKSLGFERLSNTDYFFYNSERRNKKLDKINIDK